MTFRAIQPLYNGCACTVVEKCKKEDLCLFARNNFVMKERGKLECIEGPG